MTMIKSINSNGVLQIRREKRKKNNPFTRAARTQYSQATDFFLWLCLRCHHSKLTFPTKEETAKNGACGMGNVTNTSAGSFQDYDAR